MLRLALIFFAILAFAHCSNTKDDFRVNPAARLWKAGGDKRPYQPRMLGAKPPTMKPSNFNFSAAIGVGADYLPTTFDAREKWSYCKSSINTVRNQAHCESCWAVSSAAAISDLTCIQCGGKVSPYLSDEDLITCCSDCSDLHNCVSGGEPATAFGYWIKIGLVTGGPFTTTDGCFPYTVSPYGHYADGVFPAMPMCDSTCQNFNYQGTYYADKHKGHVSGVVAGEADMQAVLYKYGPIVASFKVYKDLQKNYTGGIYHLTEGSEFAGWHAVKIIGWGEEQGQKYWLVVNSWGTNWGMNGFFKILRGTNECEIEANVVWGIASPSSCFMQETSTSTSTSSSSTTTSPTTTSPTTTSSTTTSPTTTRSSSASSTASKTSTGSPPTTSRNSAQRMFQFQLNIFAICSALIFSWKALFA